MIDHSRYCQFCIGIIIQINFYLIIMKIIYKISKKSSLYCWFIQSLFTVYLKKIISPVTRFSKQKPCVIINILYNIASKVYLTIDM
jgi:hypothetical protein